MRTPVLAGLALTSPAAAHRNHEPGAPGPEPRRKPARRVVSVAARGATTGSGTFVFRHLPIELPGAMDRRGGRRRTASSSPAGRPAPICALQQGNLVAELNIGRDLGLEGFEHIHNAVFRVLRLADGREKLHVLAYAWNPGNFAILEQVLE